MITTTESAPSCLIQGSRAADLTAPVVFTGNGADPKNYEGKDIKGKIALAGNAMPEDVKELAIHKYGTAGLLFFFILPLNNGNNQDAVLNMNLSPRNRTREDSIFGISLSNNQFKFFKDLLDHREEVIVKIKIDTELKQGKEAVFETLDAAILGTGYPDEEFLVRAHIDHSLPGMMGTSSYFGDYYEKVLGKKKFDSFHLKPYFSYGLVGYTEAHNFINGGRSIFEISQATATELWSEGYPPKHDITLTEVKNYMRMLEAAKVITIKKRK